MLSQTEWRVSEDQFSPQFHNFLASNSVRLSCGLWINHSNVLSSKHLIVDLFFWSPPELPCCHLILWPVSTQLHVTITLFQGVDNGMQVMCSFSFSQDVTFCMLVRKLYFGLILSYFPYICCDLYKVGGKPHIGLLVAFIQN